MTERSPLRAHPIDRIPKPSSVIPRPISTCSGRQQRLAALVAEARQLARRRCVVEAAAARCRHRWAHDPARRPPDGRLGLRARRLGVAFHRALDRVHAGGGHEEALLIFRAYRAELARRLARAGLPADGHAASFRRS